MSMFYCFECDNLFDGDWTESYEWGDEEICIDCHVELTPEDWEDYEMTYSPASPQAFRWAAIHKNYDGAPIHSLGPPGDPRYFIGPSLKDVWQQVIEFNETEHDPMDDGDWAYDNWKDKQAEKKNA